MQPNLNAMPVLLLALCSPAFAAQGPPEKDAEEAPRGLITKTEEATPGFTLFSPLRSETTVLIDLDGKIVHEWKTNCSPGNSAYLQANGDLIRCGRVQNDVFHGGGQGGLVQRLAWDGELLWELPLSNEKLLAHHDIAVMPNGNILVIAWEYKSPKAAKAAGRTDDHISESGFWPDMVLEYQVDEDGQAKVVWEWHAFDHLIQDADEDVANFGIVGDHPELIDINGEVRVDPAVSKAQAAEDQQEQEQRERELEERMRALGYTGDDPEEDEEEEETDSPSGPRSGDWLHTNGIDYNVSNDMVVLSVRTFSEVWVIDHSTTTAEAKGHTGGRYGHGGDLLYRLGNPAASRSGKAEDQRLFKQHDASWVGATDEGLAVLVFNNGEGRPDGSYSTVDEFLLPFKANEGFNTGRAKLVWQYKAEEPESFFASFVSGAQRLENGNTLICHGVEGQLLEVNKQGRTVWEYHNPLVGDQPLEPGGGQSKDGPPQGGPRGDGPPHRGPKGDGPPHGGPRGDGPPQGAPPGRGRSAMLRYGMFRGTHIAGDHPGLTGREL